MSVREGRIIGRFEIRALRGAMLLLLMLPKAESLPVLSIRPAMSQVQSGSEITVAITVAEVADLYAYQFDFSYSPGVLNASAVEEGAFLRQDGATIFVAGQIDNNSGSIRAIAGTRTDQGPGVSGDGLLAAISLQAIEAGLSPLTLSRITLLNSQLEGIAFQTAGASVAIVPEPDTLALISVGMLLTGLARYRRCPMRATPGYSSRKST